MKVEEGATAEAQRDMRASLRWWRLLLPMLIGLGAVGAMLWSELGRTTYEHLSPGEGDLRWVDHNANGQVDVDDPAEFVASERGDYTVISGRERLMATRLLPYGGLLLVLALFANAMRDVGYVLRLRVLSGGQFTWRQSFEVTMMWEFSNAVAPAFIGGTSIAIYVMSREGLGLGRSAALALATVMLDELFFLLFAPLVFFGVGMEQLFPAQLDNALFGLPVQALFWLGYTVIAIMKLGIFYSVFFKPRAIKLLLVNLFKHRWVRRFRPRMADAGDDLISASVELRGKPAGFWLKAIGATWCSWASRFLVLNLLAAAFFPVGNHLLMYARQLVMWIVLLISPTPGASGAAEFAFSGFMADLLPAGASLVVIALLWRLITYYVYLVAGAIVAPRWVKRTGRAQR